MFFSFFSRFNSKKSPPKQDVAETINYFPAAAEAMGGQFYSDFKLFHHDKSANIDLLLFAPDRGLYLGEINTWSFDDLKEANIERSSRISKKPSSTRFSSTEAKIQQKLQDVVSFDSTSCERFMWMKNLNEEEFDALDPSFHELLPKSRLIFCTDSLDTIIQKLENLAELQPEPYSAVKVIGSLSSHLLLLPTQEEPFGAFLSDEQNRFLSKDFNDCLTYLYGDYGSGKSTVMIRKAMKTLLDILDSKVLVITPTILSAEILRNEFVSLMEYGILEINLSRIAFFTPKDFETLLESKTFQESTTIFCDDAHLLSDDFIRALKQKRGHRWLLLSQPVPAEESGDIEVLLNAYRGNVTPKVLECSNESLLITLLLEMRKKLAESPGSRMMALFPDMETIQNFKPSIDEYLGVNCRVLTPEFSLQYENLDDVVLTTSQMICGVSCQHLFLVTSESSSDYTPALSRASESATIISFKNSDGEADEEDYQE